MCKEVARRRTTLDRGKLPREFQADLRVPDFAPQSSNLLSLHQREAPSFSLKLAHMELFRGRVQESAGLFFTTTVLAR